MNKSHCFYFRFDPIYLYTLAGVNILRHPVYTYMNKSVLYRAFCDLNSTFRNCFQTSYFHAVFKIYFTVFFASERNDGLSYSKLVREFGAREM